MGDGIKELIRDIPASESILRRYCRVLGPIGLQGNIHEAAIDQASIREGARFVPLEPIDGVNVTLVDESSLMETGTYKDLDTCVTIAAAQQVGFDTFVMSSGGNLGYSMARYCPRVGISLYFFCPAATHYKLDAGNFESPSNHLILVDLHEREVKKVALAFADRFALLHVPDIRWRLAASSVRAMHILEYIQNGNRADWMMQTMCAGYGPAGIYNCFSSLVAQKRIDRKIIPKFFGFQQQANSPMVRAWKDDLREINPQHHIKADAGEYIEPGLYNTNPERNYTRLYDLITYFGGDLGSIGVDDYASYSESVLSWFANSGVQISTDDNGEPIEKTGVLTGVGVRMAIDKGWVAKGSNILLLLTGGCRPREPQTELAQPSATVDEATRLEEWLDDVGQRSGLRTKTHNRRSDALFPDKQ